MKHYPENPDDRSHRARVVLLCGLLLIGALAVQLLGPAAPLAGHPLFTARIVMALGVVVLSLQAFSEGCFGLDRRPSRNMLALACALLASGLLQLAHVLSYPGMPEFLSSNGPGKALGFDLVARLVASAGLLGAALLPWRKSSPGSRYPLLGVTLAATGLAYWFGLRHPTALVHGYVPGQKLGALALATDCLLGAANVAAALLAFRRAHGEHAHTMLFLCTGCVAAACSDLLLAHVGAERETFVFFGHAYKIVAYWLVYRGVHAYATREPFERLRKTRAQLELSTARFSQLTELSSDWYWEQDAELRFTFVSPGAERHIGFDVQRYIGCRRWEYPETEAPAEGWEPHRAVLETHQPFRDLRITIRSADGDPRTLSISGAPVFDGRGVFRGYRGVGCNVTARVRAEQELRKLSQALEQSPVSVLVTDRDGRIEYVNAKFTEISGWSAAEALGHTPRSLKSRDTGCAVFEEIQRAMLAGQRWQGEILNRRRNGELYWENVNVAPLFDGRGTVTHYVAVEEDITHRKLIERSLQESQQQFTQLAESIEEVFWLYDVTERRHIYLSPACETVWGIPRARLLAEPKAWRQAVHPEDESRVRAYVKHPGTGLLEFRVLRPDGTVRWVQSSAVGLRDETGTVYRYAGVLFDVTAQRQARLRRQLTREVGRHILEAYDSQTGMRGVLRSIADAFGWDIGLHWQRDPGQPSLRCAVTWCATPEAEAFLRTSHLWCFACGDGSLPGTVCASCAPSSVEELSPRVCPQRHAFAAQANLRSAIAFPLLDGREVTGALEFFGRVARPRDEDFERLATVLGEQIGQLLARKRAELEALESRERLQGIVDSTMNAIIMTDSARNIVLFNPAAEQIFRCTVKNALGTSIDRFVPMHSRLRHVKLMSDYAKGGESARAMGEQKQVMGLRADGEEFPAEASIARLQHEGGTLLVAILSDISDRLRTEAELRARERQLRLINDHVPALMSHYDADGRCRFANAAYAALFGKRPEELVGKHLRDLLDTLDYNQVASHIERVFRGATVSFEREQRRPDGAVNHLEATMIPDQSEDGVVRGWYGFIADITARKQAEDAVRREREFMRQVIDTDPNLIFVKDATGRYALVNRSMARLLDGMDDGAHADATAEAADGIERDVLRTRRTVVLDEIYTRADAKPLWYHTVKTPLVMPDGTVHVLSIGTDISERKRAEDELRDLNAELEHRVAERTAELEAAVHDLEAFSYSVSHDLRAPLRAIEGFSQLLARHCGERLDATDLEHLHRIRRASLRMSELIDDLLGLSQLSRQAVRFARINVSELVRSAAAELAAASPERKVELVVQDDVFATADTRLLRIALENLLGNAWKFTASQSAPRVEFGSLGAGADSVLFVRDNGVGFDMQYSEKLFRPFQRLHGEHEFEGTGIGLATVSRVIQAHRGRVWVEARPGEGATFFFTLPASASS